MAGQVAISADWHLRGKDLDAAFKQIHEMISIIIGRNIKTLFVAGDVFDKPNIGDSNAPTGDVAKIAVEIANLLCDQEISTHIIPGQHDFVGTYPTAGNAQTIFRAHSPIILTYEKPHKVHYSGLHIGFIPWSWGPERFEDIGFLQDELDLLVAHVSVVGAVMSGDFTCPDEGCGWRVSRSFLEGLKVKRFALGDFHKRQDLFSGRGGYVGAIRQLNHGEEGNPAGFEIWTPETNEVEWIELDEAPRYRTVETADPGYQPEIDPKERLRVRFTGAVPALDQIKMLENAGVNVQQVVDVAERVQRTEIPAGVASNPHALIDLWAHSQEPPIGDDRLQALHKIFDEVGTAT